MRSLFVMDPLDKISVAGDSTYVMMRECCDRGHPVAMCTSDELFVRDGRSYALVTAVRVTANAPYFHVGERREVDLGSLDVIWMRKDPPFDMSYVFSTYMLDIAARDTLVVNHPIGLKVFNEKLWAMHFSQFQPPTLLSSDLKRLRDFVEAQPEGAVLKPWDGNGGRGVVVTRRGDRNLPALIELMTREGQDYVIAQAFLPGVEQGDKRILLIDGEPVGAILRVPGSEDHRANMHVGATVHATELDEHDLHICDALGPELKKHGQVFVGIDVIAGMLTEINVTSPTGMREVSQLYGRHLEKELVDCVELQAVAHGESS